MVSIQHAITGPETETETETEAVLSGLPDGVKEVVENLISKGSFLLRTLMKTEGKQNEFREAMMSCAESIDQKMNKSDMWNFEV